MKSRGIPHLRIGVALGLFAAFALANILHLSSTVESRPTDSPDLQFLPSATPPSPFDLPVDCAIIATEAASRLVPTGSWTRIIFIRFLLLREHRIYAHALAVWQPPTTTTVLIYDAGGTIDLGRACGHDPKKIANAWGKFAQAKILGANFI